MDNDTLDTILSIVAGSVAIALVVGVNSWCNKRSKTILQKWADANGFQIVEKNQRYMVCTGPFKWWTNSRGQIIYFLKLRDRDGCERSGWARCGSYFGGVFSSDKIEVRWEDR